MPAPLTDAELLEAFEAFHWSGWTYTAAMDDPLRSRLVKARAADIRTKRLKTSHKPSSALVKRFNPVTGQFCTQRVKGPYDVTQPQTPDLF